MPAEPTPSMESDPSERFISLLNASHARLLGFLRTMLGNSSDAEDVLQRTSILLWRRFSEFNPELSFFAWASTFAFYEAKNFQRISSRSKLTFDDGLLERFAEERLPDLEQLEQRLRAMDDCIEQLDSASRSLIRDFYLNQTQVSTLASRSGRAPQTLYNKLNVLRRLLRECMERRAKLEV